jgi:hypothetical protein
MISFILSTLGVLMTLGLAWTVSLVSAYLACHYSTSAEDMIRRVIRDVYASTLVGILFYLFIPMGSTVMMLLALRLGFMSIVDWNKMVNQYANIKAALD